jgi:hypothetical protein
MITHLNTCSFPTDDWQLHLFISEQTWHSVLLKISQYDFPKYYLHRYQKLSWLHSFNALISSLVSCNLASTGLCETGERSVENLRVVIFCNHLHTCPNKLVLV